MEKNQWVTTFERRKTTENALRLLSLVSSFNGQWNAVSGLTKTLYEDAKQTEKKKNLFDKLVDKYRAAPTLANAQKIKSFLDDSHFIHLDFGMSQDTYDEIIKKIATPATETTQETSRVAVATQ